MTLLDRWLGRGEASITTPPLDGAFRPNDRLDAAEPVLETPEPDGLAVTSLGLVVSAKHALLRVHAPTAPPVASFDAEISALAGLPDGGAALGLADGRIVFLGGRLDGKVVAANPEMACITALAPAADGALLVANGSANHGPADWKRDLMEKSVSGSVWRLQPETGARTRLAAALAYPNGLLEERDSLVVSESWRAALTRIFAWRKMRAGADWPACVSRPAIARPRRGDLARAVRAAQPTRRIRIERARLSPAYD